MTSFASLIKLSKSQNNDAAQELAAAVAKREAQQAAAKAEAAAREAREREAAKERLKRRFEEEQKAKQRAGQEAELAAKREKELDEKREREARALLAGKPAAGSRAKTTGGGENSRSKASTSGASGYNAVASGAMGLTREEKRARHTASWDDGASRSKYAAKKRKAGALLPGGALNVEAGSGSSASGGISVRARLAASQAGLIKLNTQKRDPRSIDEITRDLREKGNGLEPKKVITGVEAEKYTDWFSTKKDKEREREKERQEREERERKRQEKERLAEEARERERRAREKEREKERERDRGKDRSRSGSAQAPSQPQPKRAAAAPAAPPKPAPIVIATKPSTLLSGGTKSSSAPKEYKVTVKTTGNPPASQAVPTPTSAVRPRPAPPAPTSKSISSLPAKRRRSYDSESDSYDSEEEDRERRRRAARKSAPSGGRGSGFDIWSIINPGKSRGEYLNRDVVSDDEDNMEATGRDLEREEKQSARIAKQEDAEAEAEERRREEAKRRKKLAARGN